MEKSQQNLYTMIFRLKKLLRDSGISVEIQYKNSIYTIQFNDVYCDLIEFDEGIGQDLQVSEQNVEKFKKMISLYKGDLLEEEDYSWCINDKEKYYHHYFEIVMSVATYYAELNQRNLLEKLYLHVEPFLTEEDNHLVKAKSYK